MKSNKEHYMTKVNFYDSINDSMLKFAVIMDQTTLPEPAFNMYSKRIFSFSRFNSDLLAEW